MVSVDVRPREFNLLPSKFTGWRPYQEQAYHDMINFLEDGERTAFGTCIPAGSGKTVTYMLAANYFSLKGNGLTNLHKSVILTPTKALQNQLMTEFGSTLPISQIMGADNYRCQQYPFNSCGEAKEFCPSYNSSKCELTCAKSDAEISDIVVANYSTWFSGGRFGTDSAKHVLVICDEAHLIESELDKHSTITITREQADEVITYMVAHKLKHGSDSTFTKDDIDNIRWKRDRRLDVWVRWCKDNWNTLRKMEVYIRREINKDKTKARSLLQKLSRIKRLRQNIVTVLNYDKKGSERLLFETNPAGSSITISPIFPGDLFPWQFSTSISKFIFTSATLTSGILERLGMDVDHLTWKDYPCTFPVDRCPVYVDMGAARVSRDTSDEEMDRWRRTIDSVVSRRLDRKGIIDTVSYKNQEYLVENSDWSQFFVVNKRDPDVMDYRKSHNRPWEERVQGSLLALEKAREFVSLPPPAILVSPSFGEGWDFPYDQCEYIIISKVPFPSLGGKLVQERLKKDPGWINIKTMFKLQQIGPRGMRVEDDQCEVFILDGNAVWLMKTNKDLMMPWFIQRLVWKRKGEVEWLQPPPCLADQ